MRWALGDKVNLTLSLASLSPMYIPYLEYTLKVIWVLHGNVSGMGIGPILFQIIKPPSQATQELAER